jgi:hypothetical protein
VTRHRRRSRGRLSTHPAGSRPEGGREAVRGQAHPLRPISYRCTVRTTTTSRSRPPSRGRRARRLRSRVERALRPVRRLGLTFVSRAPRDADPPRRLAGGAFPDRSRPLTSLVVAVGTTWFGSCRPVARCRSARGSRRLVLPRDPRRPSPHLEGRVRSQETWARRLLSCRCRMLTLLPASFGDEDTRIRPRALRLAHPFVTLSPPSS